MIVNNLRFLEAPKSRRELLARERAEEERVENEMVRLAAESQMERNQRQIKQGREEMKRYQSENEASDNGGDDGEGDSDEEGENKRKSSNRRSKRQNRSVFTKSIGTVELREQINHQRLTAAVCGVSERTTSQLKSVVIPAVPTRIGGVIKLDPRSGAGSGGSHLEQRKRQLYKPVIEESRGWTQLAEARPVGLSWAVSAGYGATASQTTAATAASAAAKPKKISALQGDTDKLRQALFQQHESRITRCMRRIENTDAQRETQFSLVNEQTVNNHNDLAMAGLSLDSEGEDDGQRSRMNRANEKDAYLYGLSHFTKKKKVGKRGEKFKL
jgi:hypothetical protein